MSLLIVMIIILVILIALKFVLQMDITTLKRIAKNKELDKLTNAFPSNIEICKKICAMIGNTTVKIEEDKNSREYIEYKEMKDMIYADPKLKEQVEEFEKIKYEVQMLTIQEGKQDEQKMKKLQELYTILLERKEVKKFFDTQVRFNVMLADVNKIIGEAVKDVLQ